MSPPENFRDSNSHIETASEIISKAFLNEPVIDPLASTPVLNPTTVPWVLDTSNKEPVENSSYPKLMKLDTMPGKQMVNDKSTLVNSPVNYIWGLWASKCPTDETSFDDQIAPMNEFDSDDSHANVDYSNVWNSRPYRWSIWTLIIMFVSLFVYAVIFSTLHIVNIPQDGLTSIWCTFLVATLGCIVLLLMISRKPSAKACMLLAMVLTGQLINSILSVVSVLSCSHTSDLYYMNNAEEQDHLLEAGSVVQFMSIGLLVLNAIVAILLGCATYMNCKGTNKLISVGRGVTPG